MTSLTLPTTERSLTTIARALGTGTVTAEKLLDEALAAIADPDREGAKVYLTVARDQARAAAHANDRLRAAGLAHGPLAGLPISVKDLFDLEGEVTRAGSPVMTGTPPAAADAPAIARLRAAGAIIVGRTNMTEFAFSGLGLNPHFGTPGNPFDRSRIPGGSSSGAGVSVADGMAAAAIGSDTGGSVRVPAAFCGLAGFKPSRDRVPIEGAFPLAYSLDSVGPLAPTIDCCARLDAVMAGEWPRLPPRRAVANLRLALPDRVMLDDLDGTVAAAYENALRRLADAGAHLETVAVPEFDAIVDANRRGGLIVPEAYHGHRDRLAAHGDRYDPRVRKRIERGAEINAADYVGFQLLRTAVQARFAEVMAGYDAMVCPTVPVTAPVMAGLEADEDAYTRTNILVLRNTGIGNFLDTPAATVPCHAAGDLPVGLMVMAPSGRDRRVLSLAAAIEPLVAPT